MTRHRILVLAAAGALAAAPAAAHSLLVAASPAATTRLEKAPAEIVLRFNSRIEKRLSRLRLIDGRGEARALAPSPGGPPDELRAALPPLGPGAWRLQWQVLSVDGHVVSGSYAFEVVR